MAPPKPKPKANKRSTANTSKEKESKQATKQQAQASIPIELQQLLLNIFKNSFSERLHSDIQPLLQEVKGHLYNRDFLAAFGNNEYLETYAARWSSSRALAYLQVFADLKEYIIPAFRHEQGEAKRSRVASLGGGAGAEVVAFGGFQKLLEGNQADEALSFAFNIIAIDIANWSAVVDNLRHNVTTAPPLSKYASAAAQASNAPLLSPEAFGVSFHQHDVLTAEFTRLSPLLQDSKLVTIMFTLNELYSTSVPLTQKFLLNVTACVQPGSLLLVVDSPGSYSTVSLNGAEKKYPMQWLLDHTLLRQGTKGEEATWAKVLGDESRWFRLLPELRYPIELENMRFQLHLYRRVGSETL